MPPLPHPRYAPGHQEGRRVFWEGTKFLELCPVVLNYVQHILPGEGKIFSNPPATADYGPALNLMSHDY